MKNWLAQNANNLLYANLIWYGVLTIAFLAANHFPKFLYFLGAAILTVGVVLM